MRKLLLLGFLSISLSWSLSARAAAVILLDVVYEESGGGSMYVSVRAGAFKGSMQLDTGASTSRVAVSPWNQFLPSLGQSTSVSANGSESQCSEVHPESFALVARDGTLLARKNYTLNRCESASDSDLLGLDFFNRTLMRLNFDDQTLEVESKPQVLVEGHAPIHALVPTSTALLMGIPVRIADRNGFGMVDTGSELTAVDLTFIRNNSAAFEYIGQAGKATAADGTEWYPEIYTLKKLKLGDRHELENVKVIAYDFGSFIDDLGRDVHIILGFNVLSQFNWEFDLRDPKARTWLATPRALKKSE